MIRRIIMNGYRWRMVVVRGMMMMGGFRLREVMMMRNDDDKDII